MTEKLRAAINAQLSPRHLPDEIVPAPAVPRTATGKRLEVPLKRLLLGDDAIRESAIAAGARASDIEWYQRFGRARVMPRLRPQPNEARV